MIFSIKPFEIHDGDGIRTTVFFKGCSLHCRWCHNPESFSFERELAFSFERCLHCGRCAALCGAHRVEEGQHRFDRAQCVACGRCRDVCPAKALALFGEEHSVEELAQTLMQDALFFKGSGGGVTFSGGEPLLQAEFCTALAKRLKAQGVHLAVDTSAAVPQKNIAAIAPYVDQFLVDIKAIDEAVHIACTGVSNTQILENIRYIDTLGIPFEVRYPYVPTMNDGEWEAVAAFVKTLKNVTTLRVLPYHGYATSKYAALGMDYATSRITPPAAEEIARVVEGMRRVGVNAATF